MWEQATDNKAVTGYEVLQQGTRVKTLPATRHMVDIDRLSPKTAYSFTVRARDAAGNLSDPSAAVPVTTPAPRRRTTRRPRGP